MNVAETNRQQVKEKAMRRYAEARQQAQSRAKDNTLRNQVRQMMAEQRKALKK